MKFPIYNGLTSINLNTKDNVVVIEHTGNMGNTVDHEVKINVNNMLGRDAFNALRKAGKEKGAADYLYTLRVPKADFDAIIK